MRKLILAGSVLAAVVIGYAFANSSSSSGDSHHDEMTRELKTTPVEPGQGGFAAIAEIVAILNNDPETKWGNVNIEALRDHLVDMDELTLNAEVSTTTSDDELQFKIKGHGRTLRAIQSMVPAHVKQLADDLNWKISAIQFDDGVILTVASNDEIQFQQLSALGFFGIMATGAHHQQHHLQMARGAIHIH